ncbi:MAG: hypothetical protein WBF34_32185, partial [Streptosporangiaceae bacterium]
HQRSALGELAQADQPAAFDPGADGLHLRVPAARPARAAKLARVASKAGGGDVFLARQARQALV